LSRCNVLTPGNSNFSSNLLLYEIDLDQLGVPAGVAIDVVTIKRKQTADPLGTVPHLVMVGATNTFEVAPELSEFIRNGRFDEGADGLDHWAVVGGGTVDVGPSFTTLTAPGTPVALTQIINTPNQSFQIIFDRRFMTSAGTLLISLNGLVIHKLAGSQDTWVREEIYVNDVSLMGLQGVEFKLELLPGSDAAAAVWNIGIPEGRDLSPPNVSFELTTSNSYNREPSGEQVVGKTEKTLDPAPPGSRLEIVDDDRLNALERLFSDAYSELISLSGEVRFGVAASAEDGCIPVLGDPCGNEASDLLAQPTLKNTVRFKIEADPSMPPPSGPVDVGWDVTISGLLESGRERCAASLFGQAFVSATHVQRQLLWWGQAHVSWNAPPEPPRVHLTPPEDLFIPPSTPTWDRNDWIEVAPQFGAGQSFVVAHFADLKTAMHLPVGTIATLEWELTAFAFSAETRDLGVQGPSDYCVVDFLRTFQVTPISNTPGVRFVAVDDGGTNQPPVSNAGTDQTVEATSPAGASVTLDATGSSDPDGDALTYEWTGPFGTASGVSPIVTVPLGAHDITLTVNDGQASSQDTVRVTVRDTTPPVVTPPPDVTVFATGLTTPVNLQASGTASATDAVGVVSGPTPSVQGPFAPGEHGVQWTAADAAGNVGVAVQRVLVKLDFRGFTPPVDNAPAFNSARAGSGVPVKWQVQSGSGGYLSDLAMVTSVQYVPIACPLGGVVDGTPVDADTSGGSGLHYDALAEQFVYVWQTPKTLEGTCAQLHLSLSDGSQHMANFQFK
jgi:hypothetical protein